ncbi:MAG: peptidase M22 [Clostridia bacterium]|nr:peptidase M22 [Clostridia bacterium]
MGLYLGIDTSNYTTSVAVYNSETKQIEQVKRLLPVKEGELGLRQSDALFHHTVALPELIEELLSKTEYNKFDAVAVSNKPRNVSGSYMPCFLSGVSVARGIAAALGVPCYYFSHQEGHVAAAMYSAGRMDLINQEFVAFHLSGGTTEALLVKPDSGEHVFDTEIIAQSLDLKAGQSVDRIGVMLGLKFPAGMALDALAQQSDKEYKIRPFMKGCDCSFSGLENKAKDLFNKGEKKEDIAKYCFDYIKCALDSMTRAIIEKYGERPLLFSGGVMSNTIIKKYITERYNAFFASPVFSSDNAAGIALLASVRNENNGQ